MDHTAQNRMEKVTAASTRRLRRGDRLSDRYFERFGPECVELWMTTLTTKSGSLPERTSMFVHESKEASEAILAAHPVGSFFDPEPNENDPFQNGSRIWGEKIFNDPQIGAVFLSAADDDNYLAWRTLKEAGLNDGYRIAPKVVSFLGEDRIEKLKALYDDNWQAVAEMEYCWYNLDCSSSAYVAAQKQYHYFVSQDDFAAGYLQRDLEILVEGVEEAVARANEFFEKQSKRSAQGGAANAEKAKLRRTRFYSLALESATRWIWKSKTSKSVSSKG